MGADKESFLDHLLMRARSCPDQAFARFDSQTLTFADIDRLSDTLAARFRSHGYAKGDRVAVMAHNRPEIIPLIFGLAKAGLIWVPINVSARGEGLRYVLGHAEPKALIVEAALLDEVRACGGLPTDTRVTVFDENNVGSKSGLAAWLRDDLSFDETLPFGSDTFAIIYTSGTTGPPKGVLVSHRMMCFAGEGVALVCNAQSGDVFLVWEPLYHIGGAQMLMLPLIRSVMLVVLRRFSASQFWEQVRASGASHIHYLGGILQILLKQPESVQDRAHKVRVAWGAACPAESWRQIEERFGIAIHECYGMTEASSITTFNQSGVVGSVGRPVPWFDVAVVDPDGRPVPAGQSGEIVMRTDRGGLFEGYYKDSCATSAALRDGNFWTGDRGKFDAAGNLFFLGRLSDSARIRGENVSAWEIENVVSRHDAVEECAMIGIKADIGEQEIKLFVKPKAGATIKPHELSSWLSERLSKFQNPRYITIVASFEKTPSQRIIKRKLSQATNNCWDRLANVPSEV
jgi:crotonobetaine/carnitine-CoA ligase